MKKIALVFLMAAAACSSSTNKPSAPPPVATAPGATPTPGIRSRIDPTVIEETDTYVIRALPKKDYVRVDDYNVREPILPNQRIRFFKEDDKYYYVSEPKVLPDEAELKRQQRAQEPPRPGSAEAKAAAPAPGVTAADFEDLTPARTGARIRLRSPEKTNLPVGGMWRASFVMADMNGDGVPDIVAPPNRMGSGKLRVWIGDRKGGFSEWPVTYTEKGKLQPRFTVDYGAVAVGDLDGDGHLDVVCAAHSGGLTALYGDGKGGFRIERSGLPQSDFSSQAVTLVDANGDGKLDIVASRDIPGQNEGAVVDKLQVRVYLNDGKGGFEWKKEALVGGFYSNSLHAWDFDGSGRKSVLTGSNYTGALTLLWRNTGTGIFEPVTFDAIEGYAYHPVTVPGTFGAAHAPAFADSYYSTARTPQVMRAAGITVYSFAGGKWERHRLWREKESKAAVNALAVGDLDGDGLDDVVFADNVRHQLRVLFQQPDGTFVELDEKEEPRFESPGQWLQLADLDGDGRLDIVMSRTVTSTAPNEVGGWNVWLNRAK